jgi:hypothetical protein
MTGGPRRNAGLGSGSARPDGVAPAPRRADDIVRGRRGKRWSMGAGMAAVVLWLAWQAEDPALCLQGTSVGMIFLGALAVLSSMN